MIVKVSVILSIFSEPIEWIKESIDSMLNQTYNNFELIVVNDNPLRNENHLLLCSYKAVDERIVIITNECNLGLTKSLNKALKLSKGQFIARMDADDVSDRNRLKLQVDYLENNVDIDLCGTWAKTFGNVSTTETKNPIESNELSCKLFFGNRITHSSVVFRRSSFIDRNIFYNEDVKKAQDYDLWSTAVFNKLRLVNIPYFLVYYRQHENQISNASFDEQQLFVRGIKQRWLDFIRISYNENEFEVYLKLCDFMKMNKSEAELLPVVIRKIMHSDFESILDRSTFIWQIRKRILFYSFKCWDLKVFGRFELLSLLRYY